MSDLEIKPQDSIRDENNFNEDPSSETYTPVMTLDYRGEWSSYHIPNVRDLLNLSLFLFSKATLRIHSNSRLCNLYCKEKELESYR